MADSYDIQLSILDMQSKKSKLGAKKAALQLKLSEYKEMLKVVQQGHITFDEIVAKKKQAIEDVNEVDAEISQLKAQIKKRQALKDEVKSSEEPKNHAIKADITVLRDNYLKFAGDKTRVASMRAMAADFAGELTKILSKIKL